MLHQQHAGNCFVFEGHKIWDMYNTDIFQYCLHGSQWKISSNVVLLNLLINENPHVLKNISMTTLLISAKFALSACKELNYFILEVWASLIWTFLSSLIIYMHFETWNKYLIASYWVGGSLQSPGIVVIMEKW